MTIFCITIKKIYQCKRSVCKNADKPSITTSIAKLKNAQAANIKYKNTAPVYNSPFNPIDNTMVHNTSDNSVENKLSINNASFSFTYSQRTKAKYGEKNSNLSST